MPRSPGGLRITESEDTVHIPSSLSSLAFTILYGVEYSSFVPLFHYREMRGAPLNSEFFPTNPKGLRAHYWDSRHCRFDVLGAYA